jgi:hypothetical protein
MLTTLQAMIPEWLTVRKARLRVDRSVRLGTQCSIQSSARSSQPFMTAFSTIALGLTLLAVSGCNPAPSVVDAARQAEIERLCRAPRATSGGADAIAGCIAFYRSRPDLRLPDPADVPLPGEPGYDPPIGEAWPFCPSCA